MPFHMHSMSHHLLGHEKSTGKKKRQQPDSICISVIVLLIKKMFSKNMSEGSRNMMGAEDEKKNYMLIGTRAHFGCAILIWIGNILNQFRLSFARTRKASNSTIYAALAGFKYEIVPTNRLIIHELIRLHLHHGWFGEVTLLFLFIWIQRVPQIPFDSSSSSNRR